MSEDADDEDVAFEARYRERRARMLSEPPSCLAPFAVERASAAVDLPGVAFDGHGEPHESVFRVRCTCGGDALRVRGTFHAKDFQGDPLNFFGDPLELVCESCTRTQLLFDTRQHGYNAEIEAGEGLLQPAAAAAKLVEAPRKHYACTRCGGHAVHLWARFEHTADTCEDSFAERMTAGREQDFFTWFTLGARCAACGELQTVTEFECA